MKTFKAFAVLVTFLSLSSAFGSLPTDSVANYGAPLEDKVGVREEVANQQIQDTETKRTEEDVVLLD